MYLKSIDISGFKSFSHSTRLELSPGITGLVGPNGSGKSNVVDAVRWCLGEQSLRELRGQRAEDVIYAGARKVLGAAEVILTLEANARIDEVPWSELAIARRVFRSGDAEYLLHGDRVRLRDVAEAVRRIGIQSPRHVVVTQGMADALLTCGPLERRGLLEQAADLSEYRHRRDEAQQKVAITRQNIETVCMVLAEMEPRLRLLKRQVRALTERESVVRTLREMSVQWYGHRLANEKQAVLEGRQRVAQLGADRASARAELDTLEGRASEFLRRYEAWQQAQDREQGALQEREREASQAVHEVQRIEHARQRLAELVIDDERRERHLLSDMSELEARKKGADRNIAVLEAERAELLVTIARSESHWSDCENAVSLLRGECEPIEFERIRREEDVRAVERQLASAIDLTSQLEQKRHDAVERLSLLEEAAEGTTREHSEMEATCAREACAVNELVALAAQLRLSSKELETRCDRVVRIERRATTALHYSVTDLRQLRQRIERMKEPTNASFWSRIQIRPGWEAAVSAALADWSGAQPPVRSDELESFLAWRARALDTVPEVLWASECIEGDISAWSPLIGTVFVREEARALHVWNDIRLLGGLRVGSPPVRVVTASGRMVGPFGWYPDRIDEQAVTYVRARRRLVRLELRASIFRKRQEVLSAAVEREKELASKSMNELHSVETSLSSRRAALVQAQEELERLSRRAWQSRKEIDGLLELVSNLESSLPAAVRQRRDVESQFGSAEAALAEADLRYRQVTAELRAASDAAHNASLELRNHRATLETLEVRLANQHEALSALARERSRLETATVSIRREMGERETVRSELERRSQKARTRSENCEELRKEALERLTAVRAQRPAAPVTEHKLSVTREELNDVIARHERSLARLSEDERRVETLLEEIRTELAMDPNLLPAYIGPPPSFDEIRRLRARVAGQSMLDEAATREYNDLYERERYLRQHAADLTQAADSLEEIMREADEEMKRRFEDSFSQVSQEFSRVFTLMLRGGHATLVHDERSGGVDIVAQLPGKRTRSSTAFSGGERALVATALLFGVLSIRPLPFCILDEVDAALDEANVDRYLDVLRDVSRQTQMVVVTHNRATMAAADVLYGTTMNEAGETSVLSLDLRSAEVAG